MASVDGGHEDQPSSSSRHPSQDKIIPVYARAKFSFEGRNNDELSFRKGDIIAITQQIEGGWWEGTFGSNTGWFPSGYVTLLDEPERLLYFGGNFNMTPDGGSVLQPLASVGTDSSRQIYRQQILELFLNSEREYVNTITDFYNNLLAKFRTEKKVTEEDFTILSGNLQQLARCQRDIFEEIQQAVRDDATNAKVGGILLRTAPTLRHLLRTYCENHPQAVDLILKNRDGYAKIVKNLGSELKDFIFGLSQPFRHLEKYASALSEMERSMHPAHPDRGDTQRAAAVFREMAYFCTAVRKQKEMQLELKTSAVIEGLSSSELALLGSIVYMGSVTLGDEEALVEEQLPVDRCCVLFASMLLVLEITPKLNAYVLKQKVSTEGLMVKRIDFKPTLSIKSADGSFDTLLSVSASEELQRWLEAFATCSNVTVDDTACTITSPAAPQKFEVSGIRNVAELSPLRKAEVSQLPAALKAESAKKLPELTGWRYDHDLEMILPESMEEKEQAKTPAKSAKIYSGYCLRPYPVVRGNWAVDYSKKVNVRLRKSASQADQEDAYLLRIVEGYCDLGKKSKAAGSGQNLYHGHLPPQLIVAEDEKILMEEMVGDEVVVREKSLVDTVYSLKDQMISMQKELRQLSVTVEKEQKARRRLEEIIRQTNP